MQATGASEESTGGSQHASLVRVRRNPLRIFPEAQPFVQTKNANRVFRTPVDPIALMFVYIDTAQGFLYSTKDTDRQDLRDAYKKGGGGEWSYKKIKHDVGTKTKPKIATTGFEIKIQHPQPPMLDAVKKLMDEKRGYNNDTLGSFTRLDYAVDFLPLGNYTKDEVRKYVLAHLIMRNRRPGPIFRFERNTSYFTKNAHQNQHSRDIVEYADQLPKLPMLGKQPISHADLRARGSRTIQNDGFETMADAMSASPIEIVRRWLYFTSVDTRSHAEAEVGERRSEQALDYAIRRRQLNYGQRVKEVLRISMTPNPAPPLLIYPKLVFL